LIFKKSIYLAIAGLGISGVAFAMSLPQFKVPIWPRDFVLLIDSSRRPSFSEQIEIQITNTNGQAGPFALKLYPQYTIPAPKYSPLDGAKIQASGNCFDLNGKSVCTAIATAPLSINQFYALSPTYNAVSFRWEETSFFLRPGQSQMLTVDLTFDMLPYFKHAEDYFALRYVLEKDGQNVAETTGTILVHFKVKEKA
jgi:hypothetical protein